MSEQKVKLYKYLGSSYVILRKRITSKGFKELLARQIKPVEMPNLIYLVDYRK